MDIELSAVINYIRYLSDERAEAYLRAVLESMPPARLARAIAIAQEVEAQRGEIGLPKRVAFVLPVLKL